MKILSIKYFFQGKWKRAKKFSEVKDCEKMHFSMEVTKEEIDKNIKITIK